MNPIIVKTVKPAKKLVKQLISDTTTLSLKIEFDNILKIS